MTPPPTSTLTPVRNTQPKTERTGHNYYTEILKQAKDQGLLTKTPGFYINRFILITILSLATWGGILTLALTTPFWVAVGASIPLFVMLAALAAQYAFIAHEASHNQVFLKNKTNEWAGRILANLFAGLSYGFWMKKHTKHHGKPNQINYDPDINIRVLSFTPESLNQKKGIEKTLSKNQGWLFPFLLFFTGFDLLLDSFASVLSPKTRIKHKYLEFGLMVIRQATPFIGFLLIFQNIFVAAGAWTIMMLAFGFFMGIAFAPNHKGMPLVPENAKLGYFERQVLTSRNIKSNWATDNFMGGLNFQVEHHLFPSMPRTQLHKANKLVKNYCAENNIPFTEMTMPSSFKVIIQYLNRVGLSNNVSPFNCPMVELYQK